ncbi:MAG: hypothetical protein IPI57_12245 [Candidatus Competibacteraceae bacterium]|nr:hypothetical protein [Candidatus Competibacteraceae bacterium]
MTLASPTSAERKMPARRAGVKPQRDGVGEASAHPSQADGGDFAGQVFLLIGRPSGWMAGI